jgi:hypothetical protein
MHPKALLLLSRVVSTSTCPSASTAASLTSNLPSMPAIEPLPQKRPAAGS